MHTLVYLSSASHLFSDDELMNILNKSRENNTRLSITGLLLYCDGSILQILEGEKDKLNTLFNTISKDNRHKGVIRMIDTALDERSFSDWSMGFKQVSRDDWSKMDGFLNLNKKDGSNQLGGSINMQVISVIKSFANVNQLSKKNLQY